MDTATRIANFERAFGTADHFHSCAGCRASVPCHTPNEECNDYPGDCIDCELAEEAEES